MNIEIAEDFVLMVAFLLAVGGAGYFVRGFALSHSVKAHRREDATPLLWRMLPGAFTPDSHLTERGRELKSKSWRADGIMLALLVAAFLVVYVGIELLKLADSSAV